MKRKRMTSIIISCTLLINTMSICTYAQDREISGGEILQDLYEEQINEWEAEINTRDLMELQVIQGELNKISNCIQERMQIQTYDETIEESEEKNGVNYYQEYYGGSYIDVDKLIVCVTDTYACSQFGKDILNEESVEFKKVDFSFNELLDLRSDIEDKLIAYYEEYKDIDTAEFDLLSTIAGIGISQRDNCIVIDIANLTEEKENTFWSLFGENEHICLNGTTDMNKDAAVFKPGRALYSILSSRVIRTSMGYRALWKPKDKAVYGFTSCAHGIQDSIDKKIYMGVKCEKVMGTVRTKKYSGSVDASFIQIASGHSVGTTVKYSDSIGGTVNPDTIASNIYMTSVREGSLVYRIGSTTFKTVGVITDTDYKTTINGTTFINMTKTTNPIKQGDSGGIVYTYYDSKYVPCGIIKGFGTDFSFYIKASRVAETIHVYPY